MGKIGKLGGLLLLAAALLSGCALRTVDELYCLPKRSETNIKLQSVIDKAMRDLSYSAPIYGENQQPVQSADLDGDGVEEYLVFARDNSEKPLKILIFCQLASGYVLMDTIEDYGFAFASVEFAQVDDRPGMEIIVGRQVSNQVMRSVSVYRFTSGFSRQLMTTGYSRMATGDLDGDGLREIILLNQGNTDEGSGIITAYSFQDQELRRSAELTISRPAADFKRMTAASLQDGSSAVYVTSVADTGKLLTDVFTMRDGQLAPVSKGIATQTLHNFYIYPTDVDGDGVLELAQRIPMTPAGPSARQEYLLRWYALNSDGSVADKLHTYHNFADGWYLRLDSDWTDALSVVQSQGACAFYMRNTDGTSQKIMTIRALTDADREEETPKKGNVVIYSGRVVLYSGDSVIFVADLEPAAKAFGITAENLPGRFFPIRVNLSTEED